MKKTYITPETTIELAQAVTMIAASIVNVGGDAKISIENGEAPDEADVKEHNSFGESIFD